MPFWLKHISPDYRLIMTFFIALAVVVGPLTLLLILVRWRGGDLERSPREVADILRRFIDGEATGHLADNFISIPIADPALDEIRNRFEQLVERHPTWQPQAPFPETGIGELSRLVHDAEMLAR